jgi:hypothetical protein
MFFWLYYNELDLGNVHSSDYFFSGSDERHMRQLHAHPGQVRERGLRKDQQVTTITWGRHTQNI